MKKFILILAIATFATSAASAQATEERTVVSPKIRKILGPKEPVVVVEPRRAPNPVIVETERRQHRRNLPPGQAKKLYGHQSARAFAPGQQKKNRGNVWNDDNDTWNSGSGSNKVKHHGKSKGKGKWKNKD